MNDDLASVKLYLERISNLVTAPHWTAERKGQVYDHAQRALFRLALFTSGWHNLTM